MVKVNLKGVQTGVEVLPDGDVMATLVSFKNGKTKKGEDRVTVRFTVDTPKELNGKTALNGYNLGPESLWAFKKDMINAGVDPDALEEDGLDTDEILQELVGTQVALRIGHHEHEGKVYNNIQIIEEDAFSTPG